MQVYLLVYTSFVRTILHSTSPQVSTCSVILCPHLWWRKLLWTHMFSQV